MRRLIDAARQPRGNDKTGLAEIPRERAGKFETGAGGVARTDHRDHRPHQRIKRAADAEQRRRIVERGEPWRITGFARREKAHTKPLACGKLIARVFLAANPSRTISPATTREIRQPLQRGARAAEMMDQ